MNGLLFKLLLYKNILVLTFNIFLSFFFQVDFETVLNYIINKYLQDIWLPDIFIGLKILSYLKFFNKTYLHNDNYYVI